MAQRSWVARATPIKQVSTVTIGGTVAIGDTFSIHIGSDSSLRTLTFTATVGTTANVVDGLHALLVDVNAPTEFEEMTWTKSDPVLTGTATSSYMGVPVTITVSKVSAAGTISTSTTTAATGPSFVDNVNNWSGGTLPVNSDNIDFSKAEHGPKYALTALAAVAPATIEISPLATYDIGLPRINTLGAYTEYRNRYLQFNGCTLLRMPNTAGNGSGLVRLDFLASAFTAQIDKTGTSSENGMPTVNIIGTHADNALEVNNGSVGVAVIASESATIKTATVAGGQLDLGPGATANGAGSVYTVHGGLLYVRSAMVTVNIIGGEASNFGAGAVTTLTVDKGGVFNLRSTGTVTTCNLVGTLDCSEDISSRTVTTLNLFQGAVVTGKKNLTVTTTAWDNEVSTITVA
jgi:hypothetical protein